MRRYGLLSLLFVSACALWTLLFFFVQEALDERALARSRRGAEEIAQHLVERIESRIKALRVLANWSEHIPDYDQSFHNQTARIMIEQFDGFFGINWTDANGVIRWVYPEEPNRPALGKNILIRKDLAPMLEDSRRNDDVMITTRIMTYLGFYALVAYAPIYRDGKFGGWMNGVIEYNKLLDRFLVQGQRNAYSIQLQWSEDEEPFYTRGDWAHQRSVLEKSYPMFNRQLNIKMGVDSATGFQRENEYFLLLFAGGIAVLLWAFWSLARLMRSEKRLRDANLMLTSKNTLVSALSHDLSTSVMILNNNLRRLHTDSAEKGVTMGRLERTVQSVLDLLLAVRDLHVDSFERQKHELKPIHLVTAVEEALELVRDLAEKKQLTFRVANLEGYVCANRVTLINCVLLNVFQNAIKFSPGGERIEVRAENQGGELGLVVQDRGVGIEPLHLKRLFLTMVSPTTTGTAAEAGSGLGLFQVKYFVESYGGRVEILSDPAQGPGTTVKLWFRRMDQP